MPLRGGGRARQAGVPCVSARRDRHQGYGHKILDAGIAAARERYGAETIRIEAQTYARKLYENHGFRQDGEEFLEDDIPHIPMIWHAPKV